MPKRKFSDDDDSDTIRRKIRRMEKKLKNRRKHSRRLRAYSSGSDSSGLSNIPVPSTQEDVEDILPVYDSHDDINDDCLSVAESTSRTPTRYYETYASTAISERARTQGAPSVPATGTTPATARPTSAAEPAPAAESVPAPETAPSPGPTPVIETLSNNGQPITDEIVLDEELLNFLGEVPSKEKKFGPKIQSDIANRWEHIATSGVTKEVKKDLQEKYVTPENCKLIDPPKLNLEVKAALTDSLQKKDIAIENKQKQISAAVSCIGQAVKRALSQDRKDPEMIKLLIDAGRIVCDVQHTESMSRRSFIGSYIKKEVKEHLIDTKIDQYLFGDKLADTLRTAKSIHKSGTEIRANTSNLRPVPRNRSRPLNSKGPVTTTRPPPAGRRFEHTSALPPPPAPQPPAAARRRPPPPPPPPVPRSQQRPRAHRR